MCGIWISPVSSEMSGKHLAVAAVKPDIAWGSCGLVTALPVDRKQSSLALCYSLSVCPWSNINSAGSDRHTLSPPVLVGPVCACLKRCRTPARLCHRGSKRNNSDKSTENTHIKRIHPPIKKGNLASTPSIDPVGMSVCPGCIQAQSEDGGEDYTPTAYSLLHSSQPPAEMSSIRHSYLVAAASRAHPSPFPTPCRRSSSASSALINLITNRRIDPRPIYLSTYVCPGCLRACFGPRQPHPAELLKKYQMFFSFIVCYLCTAQWYHQYTRKLPSSHVSFCCEVLSFSGFSQL